MDAPKWHNGRDKRVPPKEKESIGGARLSCPRKSGRGLNLAVENNHRPYWKQFFGDGICAFLLLVAPGILARMR